MARRLRSRNIAAATAVLAGIVPAFASAPAQASLLSTVSGTLSQAGCPTVPLSRPFVPWVDYAQYKLVSAGDFEGPATGWALAGGAERADGNESFQVGGSADSSSLALPSGSSAVSPAVCVSVQEPTVRLFGRGVSGHVRADVIYKDPILGLTLTLPLGSVSPSGEWRPTNIMVNLASPLGLVGGSASVRIRFTAVGGDWQIDDVYVDPYARG
jgi:hypothetical protein